MTIVHETWGEVEGVEPDLYKNGKWWRRGSSYEKSKGWREKKEEMWVEVTQGLDEYDWGCLFVGYSKDKIKPGGIERLRCVERYDLPEHPYEEYKKWSNAIGQPSFNEWLKQFKKPCLIVERKVEHD